MNNEIRFFAKTVQKGKTFYSALTLSIALLIIALLNLAPLMIERFFSVSSFTDVLIKAFAAFVLAAVCFFAFAALALGSKRYFLRCCKGENKRIANLFHFFVPSEFLKTFRFAVCFYSIRIACLAVSMLPAAVMLFLWVRMVSGNASLQVSVIFLTCAAVMLLIGLYFYLRAKRLFFLCSYLFAAGEETRFLQCMKMSMQKMEHETRRLFMLRTSFIGWLCLCVFLLPIFYVWSYYEQTMAAFAGKMMEQT
ncbi:MAG: DUF975 family protein [Ruminococcus sp.]|nr:DUF975 family protein [Ruminococcus sp.]